MNYAFKSIRYELKRTKQYKEYYSKFYKVGWLRTVYDFGYKSEACLFLLWSNFSTIYWHLGIILKVVSWGRLKYKLQNEPYLPTICWKCGFN